MLACLLAPRRLASPQSLSSVQYNTFTAWISLRRRRLLLLYSCLMATAVRTQSYKAVQWSLKTMALGWFTYKSYEYCSGIDTLFAGSSVALIRSKDPYLQSSGVWRVNRFHSSSTDLLPCAFVLSGSLASTWQGRGWPKWLGPMVSRT